MLRFVNAAPVGLVSMACKILQRASESSARCVRHLSTSLETEYQKEINDILDGYQFRAERKQALVGTVVSVKCMKTINVKVSHKKFIPKYDKHIRRHIKVMAHDANGEGEIGDLVRIVPCRPMSRKKRHQLKDIIKKAPKLDLSGETDV